MILLITDNITVAGLQEKFNEFFPYLKIEFTPTLIIGKNLQNGMT
jgi:hypothetical protein